jgi:hypothetical protein
LLTIIAFRLLGIHCRGRKSRVRTGIHGCLSEATERDAPRSVKY